MSTFTKPLRKLAMTAMLTLAAGTVSSAYAAGVFTVDPNSIPGVTAGSTFQADFVSGSSSARIENTGGTSYDANGYIQFTGFSLNSSSIGVATTRLGLDYGLYATFTQTFSCPALLGPGVTCSVDTIDLNVFADPGFQNTFNMATLASNPSVVDVGGDDILLGSANVVIAGVAGINTLGGAFENVNTNFLLTAAGSQYFIDPVPFFNFAFSEFNNTSTGLQCSPSCAAATVAAINGESGGTQFLQVPEPATLGLIGVALFAAGIGRRRKS
jgi:hypothetical protein